MREDINELIRKYLDDTATPEEKTIVENWYREVNRTDIPIPFGSKQELDETGERMLAKLQSMIKPPVRLMAPWRKWAAAAAILLLGTGSYFLLFNKAKPAQIIAATPVLQHDVAPGGNKAVLTLGNGATIILDSAHIGKLAEQKNAVVIKSDSGKLVYESTKEKSAGIVFNTLSTPRGGQYQLTLPDGSKVWLNAASSITYPTAFTGTERKVTITGEAYFEVVHNAAMPFHVSVNGIDVEDLGTHFNINAYTDEPEIKTTLLEGSVRIAKANHKLILKPGQQAIISNNQRIEITKSVDLDDVVAWKDGKFRFNSVDIQSIMRQAARWYDVEVEYEDNGKVNEPETFSGGISRNVNVSELLHILEITGKVHFDIEGKKIIVKPT